MNQHGFAVISADAPGWKPFDWREFIFGGYVESLECPIHKQPWDIIAAIAGRGTGDKINVVCCPICGLVGYSMRPVTRTIADYYRSTWMHETAEQALQKAQDAKAVMVHPANYGDKDQSIFEVGAGYGSQIALFQHNGYMNVEACEACPARARAVRETFGIKVYDGDFLHVDTNKKFDTILTVHVLEHVADPVAFISKCWTLQNPGGKVVISIPNFYAEPSIGVLLFWPHLWSHTAISITSLFNHCGYVVDELSQGASLEMVATKAQNSDAVQDNARQMMDKLREQYTAPGGSHSRYAIDKLLVGLGLAHKGDRVITWQKACDGVATHPKWHDDHLPLESRWDRKLVVAPVEEFMTAAPIEIQFPNGIELFYK